MANLITRTVVTFHLSGVVVYQSGDAIDSISIATNTHTKPKNEQHAVRILAEAAQAEISGKVLAVTNMTITQSEQVFGITYEDFMMHAIPVTRPESQQKKQKQEEPENV